MHILIISCSSKKNDVTNSPAIDLYNGVFFSVIKRAMREMPEIREKFRLLIVSAQYGLICAESRIDNYDLKMTPQIAKIQKEENTNRLKDFIRNNSICDITVVMGKQYLESIDFSEIQLPIKFVNGEIGMMLHDLKTWIYQL